MPEKSVTFKDFMYEFADDGIRNIERKFLIDS